MSKYTDLELALNELLRLYEEDVDRYAVEIRCGVEIPETFDYRRASEALRSLPTIEVSDDCISRKWLLDKAEYGFDKLGEDYDINHMLRDIKTAPSVVPKARPIEMHLDVTDDVVDRAVEQIRAEGEDCISREWVYNELTKVTAVTPTQIDMLSDFTDIIKYAPSVVPTTEQSSKVGEWQITDAYPHNVYCSECHKKFAQTHWAVWEDGSLPRNYCPNCGAKMKGQSDDKERGGRNSKQL